ncbi:MAG TPA: ROK family transcriptional regulator [Anaerolineae bacterium]|nr:ROK family transcriptional regulator [Anaerolineae bacterium]
MPKMPYAHQKDARQQNASALLRDLWYNAPLSKAMLAQRNDLTKATVSAICGNLLTLGLIQDNGQDRTGLGRPGNLLELNSSARCAIGVEVSTNYSAVVLTNFCNQALWQRAALIAVGSSQEAFLAHTEAMIAEAIDQARARDIPLLGIGVGVPGIVDPGPAGLVSAPALGWKEVPLKQIWEECYSLPVIVENRARAAAMAEAISGSAQGAASFVYVSIGTDVRSSVEAAVVQDGFPQRGAHGLAVDAGHMILDPAGPTCSCGQRGCWQALVDVAREAGLLQSRLLAGETSVLQGLAATQDETLEHRAIHQAAVEHDAVALEVVRTVLHNHALGITNLVRLFDPEVVVIGYANLALPDEHKTRMRILDAMSEIDIPGNVRKQLAQRGVPPPAIVYAAYGAEACMLGAAALVVGDFMRTPPVVES